MAINPINLGPNVGAKEGKIPYRDLIDMEFAPGEKKTHVAGSIPDLEKGTPSLFNPYAVVVFPNADGTAFQSHNADLTNRLLDGGQENSSGSAGYQGNLFSPPAKKSVPTVNQLVTDPVLADKTPYYYTDFLYCKYIGKIPLNQLITLRRYPAPTYDNLAVPAQNTNASGAVNEKGEPVSKEIKPPSIVQQKEFYPIAQAVTWFGEETGNKLSEILSFTVTMNWKLVEAEVNTVSGNEQGSEDSPMPGVAKWLGILTGNVNTPMATANSQYDPYNNGPLAHRVYGPVNTISKTYKRDRGLDFKQSMTLNFHYSLKSIGNINPKAAMLDLMSNLLALTYNNAGFWGGANRYFPQAPTYPFLGGPAGMNAWYRGDPVGFAKAVGAQVTKAFDNISKILGDLAEDPIGTLKKIATGAAKLGMIEMGKGRAPAIVSMKSLLTGEPVGEWHMVVGSPYDPIATIGNLICTEAKFEFNDVIGADNFPTELKVAIAIEHGRPRDAGDIQSIFNRGQGRIYYPPEGKVDWLNKSSATMNSKNDTSWGKKSSSGGSGGGTTPSSGNAATRYARSTKSVGLLSGTATEFDQIAGVIGTMGTQAAGVGKQAMETAEKMFLKLGSHKN